MDAELASQLGRAVDEGQDLESVSRPLLELLHKFTGLESTYLTAVHWDRDEQEVLFSRNSGNVNIPEGLKVEWSDTLCRQALVSGRHVTTDAPTDFPESETARELGLQTYVSVPISGRGEAVVGTLCGASASKTKLDDDFLSVMDLFARLIADQWERDRAVTTAGERVADAEEKLRERAMFVAEAEHKLKSPLTVIKGWASLLLDDSDKFDETTRRDAIQRIASASETMAQQIDGLLGAARGEALASSMDLGPIDVSKAVIKVGDELKGASSKHEVTYDVEPLLVATADENAIWHVLMHLGENAIKYSPGGGKVVFSTLKRDGAAVIEVSDDGPGLPEGIDVFKPFVRGDSSTTGTGLGLHIVRTLVTAMGGSISARSQAGEGTTFTISLAK